MSTDADPRLLEGRAERFRRYLLRMLTFEDGKMVLPHALGEARALYPDMPDEDSQGLVVTVLDYLIRNDEIELTLARFEDGLPADRPLTRKESLETVKEDWWRRYPPIHEDPSRLVLVSPTARGEAAGRAVVSDPDLSSA
jgi:hypothetical protein